MNVQDYDEELNEVKEDTSDIVIDEEHLIQEFDGYKDDELRMEYQICHEGYNSRDITANDIFYKISHIFLIYVTVINVINVITNNDIDIKLDIKTLSIDFHYFCCSFIGIAGFLSMISLLAALESLSSCKVALRKRCIDIEDEIKKRNQNKKALGYWDVIRYREKYIEERIIKGKSGDIRDIKEGKRPFVWASRLLILIWILIVFLLLKWGEYIQITSPC